MQHRVWIEGCLVTRPDGVGADLGDLVWCDGALMAVRVLPSAGEPGLIVGFPDEWAEGDTPPADTSAGDLVRAAVMVAQRYKLAGARGEAAPPAPAAVTLRRCDVLSSAAPGHRRSSWLVFAWSRLVLVASELPNGGIGVNAGFCEPWRSLPLAWASTEAMRVNIDRVLRAYRAGAAPLAIYKDHINQPAHSGEIML